MGVMEAARGLVWPAPAPVPLRVVPPPAATPPAEAKALADATVPREWDWAGNWEWQDGADGSLGLVGGYGASYAALYRRQVWVYAVVNTLSRGLASLPLKTYRRDGDARVRDRAAPLARLLAQPYARAGTFRLIEKLVADVAVYGNALAVKFPATGPPTQLIPLSPRNIAIDRDGDYRYREPGSGAERGFRRERVVHAAYYNPLDETSGFSPLEALRYSLATENAAQRLGVATFANGARPSGVIATDQDVGRERLAELKGGIARLFQGVDKTGLPAVLTNGLKWQPMSWNLQDAAVPEFRQLHRTEVCAAYHVPPTVVGELTHATFANVVELNRMLSQHAFRPWATMLEETLGQQLVPDFGDPDEWFVEFDFREMLRANTLDQFAAYSQALNAGFLTQNEVRMYENLPAVADIDADTLHRPLALTPQLPAPAGPGGS